MKMSNPNDAPNYDYHLFGNLWLEDPKDHLDLHALKRLQEFKPLIQELERRRTGMYIPREMLSQEILKLIVRLSLT